MVPTFARWRAAGDYKTKNKTLPRGHPIIATNRVGDMGLGTEKSWQIRPPWWPFSGLLGHAVFDPLQTANPRNQPISRHKVAL